MRPPPIRGIFRTDDVARAAYAESAGIARIIPRAVAVPADAADVAAIVRWAHEERVPLVPRGSGSSMANGAIGDGVIVDLSRLRARGAVDVSARRIWAEPGVLRNEIDAAGRALGLRFPVDPSSGAFCTIGGMAATNAAGARTLRFGATRRWVTALDCVFDDGTRATVRRGEPLPAVPAIERFEREVGAELRRRGQALSLPGVRKTSSGYAVADYARSGDVVDLLVGSEGTLALFVGVEVALAPAAGATASLLAAFRTLEDAVVGAAAARARGASACELLDRTFLDVAESGGGMAGGVAGFDVPPDAEAVLLIEIEADAPGAARDAATALGDELRNGGALRVALGLDAVAEHALWELRHAASPILARLDPSLASMQFIEDGAVPPARLPAYVRGVRAALDRAGVRGVIFGHAGDAHVHANALIDVSHPEWRAQVDQILDDVTALTGSLGGTLSGEHGDGRLRAPLLNRTWSADALALFARVKHAFDPEGILDPGVKVSRPGDTPIADVKYDPSLPPLPAPARAALDRVARDRLYARSRLELLGET